MRPLLVASIAYLAGVLLSLRYSPAPVLSLLLAIGSLGLWAALARARHSRSRRPVTGALVLMFATAGVATGAVRMQQVEADCRTNLREGERIAIRGLLGASALKADAAEPLPPLLPLENAEIRGHARSCTADLRVGLPPLARDLPAGTRLTLLGRWRPRTPPVFRSPWPANPSRAGHVATDSLVRIEAVEPLRDPLLFLRGRTEERIQRLFPRHSAIAEALILGRRERMDGEIRDRFARAGIVHLLAISGAHVGVLAAALLLVGSAAGFSRSRVAAGTIVLILFYLALIGAPPSAVRAGTMLSLVLTALMLQRPAARLPMIAAAAIPLLAADPMAALDPGFQLSFAGVLGLLPARAVNRSLPRALAKKAVKPLAEATVVSVLAFAATAPITAHHFQTLAPVSVLANLPAIPLTGLALIGILLSLVVAPIAPAAATLIADGTGAALDLLDRVATVAAGAPNGSFAVTPVSWSVWLLLAAVLVAVWHFGRRLRPQVRAATAAGMTVAFTLLVLPLSAQRRLPLEVHFIDVGQGDATAIRTQHGRWILVDTGPASEEFDAGERRVLPFLRSQGVRALDLLLLTHPDADHVGGAAAVVRGLPVGHILDPGLPVGKGLYRALLEVVDERDVPWRVVRAGRTVVVDGVRFEFLWPDSVAIATTDEANDVSAITLVSSGEFSLLLTGDAPVEVEEVLVRRHGRKLRADVLKAGHHGSHTSTSATLLRASRPDLVVISAGRRNRYGHPAPQVLRRLREHGIPIARTDVSGTVSLEVTDRAVHGWRIAEP